MYKQRSTLIAIGAIILFYVIALIDYFWPATFGSEYMETFTLLSFANKIVLITLLINGTLVDSGKFKIIKIAFYVTILGAIFKILHLPGADQLLLLCNLAFLITYLLHFFSKAQKHILDILKLLLVFLLAVSGVLVMYNRSLAYDVGLAGDLVCVVTFLYFLYAERDSYLKNQNF